METESALDKMNEHVHMQTVTLNGRCLDVEQQHISNR